MTKITLAAEAEISAPKDMSLRASARHGRHVGKEALAFPDLLDGITTARNSEKISDISSLMDEPAAAPEGAGEPAGPLATDDVADEGDAAPVAVPGYLQRLALFMQRPWERAPVAKEPGVEAADKTSPEVEQPQANDHGDAEIVSVVTIPPQAVPVEPVLAQQPAVAASHAPVVREQSAAPLAVAASLITLIDRMGMGEAEPAKPNADRAGDAGKTRAPLPRPQFLITKPVMENQDTANDNHSATGDTPQETPAIAEGGEPPRAAGFDGELQVLKVETSFAPAMPAALVTQFSKAVATGLETLAQAAIPASSSLPTDPRPEMVKNLQLRLHPADLGEIRVGMHLRGEELHLKIEVTTKQVETILQNDRQVLRDLLGKAGYDISDASVVISFSPGDMAAPVQKDTGSFNAPQQHSFQDGGRQHPGQSSAAREQFQNGRRANEFQREFHGDDNAKIPPGEQLRPRRAGGVFI